MSISEVIAVAQKAGFTGTGLITAVAIAIAESGLNPIAINYNNDSHNSVDRGLWQINSYWHPEFTAPDIFNTDTNARAAYAISKGGKDFTPWVTFKTNAYRKYTDAVAAATEFVADHGSELFIMAAIAAYLILN
jgi:Lysozyme like domain